jgi:hypothetical protein
MARLLVLGLELEVLVLELMAFGVLVLAGLETGRA